MVSDRCLGASSNLVMMVLPGVRFVVDGFISNNRSVPAMKMAVEASEILLSIAKFPDAIPHLLEVQRLFIFIICSLNS